MKDFMNRPIERKKLSDFKRDVDLLVAAETNDLVSCRAFLEKNPKEAWKTDEVSYFTPLHLAANKGHVEACKLILDFEPAIINRKSKSGETALHLAALRGHEEIVKLLLMRDADETLVNFHKMGTYTERLTPKEVAISHKFDNIVKIFDNWDKYKVKRAGERKELEEFKAKQDAEKEAYKAAATAERVKFRKNHELDGSKPEELAAFLQEKADLLAAKNKEWDEQLLAFYQSHKTLKIPPELIPPPPPEPELTPEQKAEKEKADKEKEKADKEKEKAEKA